MSKSNTSIYVSSLKKSYQDNAVLKDVNFSVPSGSIYALLGSNGAGKTTAIRILTTQIRADSGDVQIEGYHVVKQADKIHKVISLTGQFAAVDETLTGKENLRIMGQLYHLSNPEKRAYELLKDFGLSDAANLFVSTYSGGMKRKLDIAMSLVGHPSVIFLDEPTTGLDPQSRRSMWNTIKELNQTGVTIFLTTQYLEEAEALADTIAILDNGEIIAEGSPTQLKAYLPQSALEFVFENTETLGIAATLMKDYKVSVLPKEHKLTIFTDENTESLPLIFHRLYQNNISFQNFSQLTPSLEDVFLSMIAESEDSYNEHNHKKI